MRASPLLLLALPASLIGLWGLLNRSAPQEGGQVGFKVPVSSVAALKAPELAAQTLRYGLRDYTHWALNEGGEYHQYEFGGAATWALGTVVNEGEITQLMFTFERRTPTANAWQFDAPGYTGEVQDPNGQAVFPKLRGKLEEATLKRVIASSVDANPDLVFIAMKDAVAGSCPDPVANLRGFTRVGTWVVKACHTENDLHAWLEKAPFG